MIDDDVLIFLLKSKSNDSSLLAGAKKSDRKVILIGTHTTHTLTRIVPLHVFSFRYTS